MTNSASELVEWIRGNIRALAMMPTYGSRDAVYNELVRVSGMSKSSVMKLDQGQSTNPTAATIDKLIDAIKQALRKAAA